MLSLKKDTPYLTISNQYTLLALVVEPVAGTYAVMKFLGKEGYRYIVNRCMALTYLLMKKLKIDVHPVIDPVMNIVALSVLDPKTIRKELANKFGWQVSITKQPPSIRLVVMPHMTEENIIAFVQDLKKVLEHLKTSANV